MARQFTSSAAAAAGTANVPQAGVIAIVATAAMLVAGAAGAQPSPVAEQDFDALARVRSRAEAGRMVAQFTLGSVMHYGGFDVEEAVSWIRRAAEAGHTSAQFELGRMHQFGVSTAPSDAEALIWFRRAASAGEAVAQRVVGDFYRDGRGGVDADARQATEWYRRAADGDDIRAQYYLGQMYFDGRDLPRDYASAYQWFALAAGQAPLDDNRKALIELRNIAAARMSPDAVEAAARHVAAWRPVLRR
jgi:TPR repeat protein